MLGGVYGITAPVHLRDLRGSARTLCAAARCRQRYGGRLYAAQRQANVDRWHTPDVHKQRRSCDYSC